MNIERRIDKLESQHGPEEASGRVVIYDKEDGVPEEPPEDASGAVVYLPDNGRAASRQLPDKT